MVTDVAFKAVNLIREFLTKSSTKIAGKNNKTVAMQIVF